MNKILIGTLLVAAICSSTYATNAQSVVSTPTDTLILESIPATAIDTLTAQTVTTSVLAVDTLATDTTARSSFFRRIYNYFANSNEDKTEIKKFDFSIIGGPHYSSDTKFGIGLVAAGLYRIDKNDLSIAPSNVSLYGDISTSGFYLLGIRGNTLFKGAKYRLDFTSYFFSMPSAFWGIGYDNGAKKEPSQYKRQQTQVKVDFMYRVAKNLYIGTNASFNFIRGLDFTNEEFLAGQKKEYTNVGLGAFVLYDSRDFIPNAFRGIYVKLDQRFFPGFLGNHGSFVRTELIADFYHPAWRGATIAYDLHSEINTGDAPWTMLALTGGSYRMRGYYEGRYRDKGLLEAQVELRQKIYGRSGVALWVGAGNVFPSLGKFDISKTLPNYGIGYRWEFKKRVNVRLDYGFGKDQNGFIFSINEAF